MRGDNASAVQWVLNCKGGKDDARAGGMMRILGALEERGGGGRGFRRSTWRVLGTFSPTSPHVANQLR